MTTERTAIATQQTSQGQSLDLVSELMASLAMVRPVGMNDDAASDWVAVAAAELSKFPAWWVVGGLKAARLEASHHGQIVPLTMKHMKAYAPWMKVSDYTSGRKSARELTDNREAQKLIESTAKGLRA